MSRRTLARPQHLPGRDRVAELLGWLQVGMCGACGRARYVSRREARYAARLASPGTRLRAYRCGTSWHLGTPAGRAQVIASPVTAVRPQARTRPGLDLRTRVERACGSHPMAGRGDGRR